MGCFPVLMKGTIFSAIFQQSILIKKKSLVNTI